MCPRLSGPILRDIAIVSLRFPLSRDTFSAIPAIPKQGAIPSFGALFYTDISLRYPILQHIARYLCDTPGKQAPKTFATQSLKVSRDVKSIAAGPLRPSSRFLGSVVPVFVPSFRFLAPSFRFFCTLVPALGVQGTSAKTTLLETKSPTRPPQDTLCDRELASGAIASRNPLKQKRNRGCDSQPRP